MWDQSNLALAALEIKDLQTSSRALVCQADSSELVQLEIFRSLTGWKKLSFARIVDKGVFALFTKGGYQFPGKQRCAVATTLIFQISPCSYSVSVAAKSQNWHSALISEGGGSPGSWAPHLGLGRPSSAGGPRSFGRYKLNSFILWCWWGEAPVLLEALMAGERKRNRDQQEYGNVEAGRRKWDLSRVLVYSQADSHSKKL